MNDNNVKVLRHQEKEVVTISIPVTLTPRPEAGSDRFPVGVIYIKVKYSHILLAA